MKIKTLLKTFVIELFITGKIEKMKKENESFSFLPENENLCALFKFCFERKNQLMVGEILDLPVPQIVPFDFK